MEVFSNGALLLTLLVGTALTFPVSLGLIRLYRSAVERFMNAPANSSWNASSPSDASFAASGAVPALPAITVLDRTSSIPTTSDAQALYSSMQSAKWRAAAVYTVAGVCYAFVIAVAFAAKADGELGPLRIMALTVVFAFPVVLTINITTAANLRAKLVTAAIYFLILAVASVFTLITNPAINLIYIALLFFMMNLPGTITLQFFLMRRIRAVAPLVLIFMFLIVWGSQFAVAVAGSDERLIRFTVWAGERLAGLNATGSLIGLFVLGIILLAPVGWLTLLWLGERYENKKISDQTITIDAVWLLFSIIHSLLLASRSPLWGLCGLLAFLVYRLVLRIGFAVSGTPVDDKKLLLLRVFSLGKDSERLFRALSRHWRYAGSVRLIAGPDLAESTIEPHEFLDFVSGNLSRLFIDKPETLDSRLPETGEAADWDGRFRVNDFLCYDNTWKMVLSRLVSESDAVLMDLRGFSSDNKGCIHEINELINLKPLEQIVFIIDDRTDGKFLLEKVRQSWERMKPTSPNRLSRLTQLRLFRFADSGGDEFPPLLQTLCAAAGKN